MPTATAATLIALAIVLLPLYALPMGAGEGVIQSIILTGYGVGLAWILLVGLLWPRLPQRAVRIVTDRVRRLDAMPKDLAIVHGVALGLGTFLVCMLLLFEQSAAARIALVACAVFLPLGLLTEASWRVRQARASLQAVPAAPPERESDLHSEMKPATMVVRAAGFSATLEPAPSLLAMATIPEGTFRMGSPDTEKGRLSSEGPQHAVTLTAFEMTSTLVTRAKFRTVMGEWRDAWGDDDEKAQTLPATHVSWYDAVQFCNALSLREGLRECYRIGWIRGETEVEAVLVEWIADTGGYRLPTEAEWEYACRAGSTTRFSFGDDDADLAEHAWYRANADGVRPVGTKLPNAWHLHDMHGNVWEWCWDWHGAYQPAPNHDPRGPRDGAARVLRGGSWFYDPRRLRSAVRVRRGPSFSYVNVGFRCVRALRRQHA